MANEIEQLAEIYDRCKNDLVLFRQMFLPAEHEVKPAWFHYKWGDVLLNGNRHYAVEGFRESAKTSYVLRAFPIHCLVFPSKKKQYIVFIMANQRAASRRLKDIAEEYTSNELMNLNLVRIKEQSEKAFEVIVKDENGEEITVRMEAYGKGSSVRGLNNKDRRPDIILIDDPQDLEDSLSDTVQKSDYQWFLSDVYFLGKNTRIFFIGNNLGERCIIEQVISNKDELDFDAERIPVLNEKGESNWEEMYPVTAINEEREKWRKLGQLDIWEREKLCIAISPESQIFKKEYFRYYDNHTISLEECSVFVACKVSCFLF